MYQRAKRNTQAYRNKVIFGDTVLIDLTADTVTPDKILSGFTAHDQSGAAITGTCEFDVDSGDATVQVAEIIKGQTAYARGAKLTGTMTNNGAVSLTISTVDGAVTIPQGYHDGGGKVGIAATEQSKLIPGNIKAGVKVLGVTGTYGGEEIKAQSKSVTPSTSQQTVQPDVGYDYLASVTVAAIPYNEAQNSAGGTTVTIG